jgi:hypothetical protein
MYSYLINVNEEFYEELYVYTIKIFNEFLLLAAFALALAGIVGVFFEPTPEAIRDGGQKWALIYVAIGVGCWIFGMLQVSKEDLFFLP